MQVSFDTETLFVAKLAVKAGFKLLVASAPWTKFFFTGILGNILATPFIIFISYLAKNGILKLDTFFISSRVKFEEGELDAETDRFIKRIQNKKSLSEEEKDYYRHRILDVAAQFASYQRLHTTGSKN